MAPTMTSVRRLMEIAGVFAGDLRVQTIFTVPPDALGHGTETMLDALGVPVVPWHKALSARYDLAITANYGGIAEVDVPIALFPHSASRNKRVRPHGRGSLRITAPVRVPRSPQIQDDMLVPAAVAVGHEHELAMLAEDCPEALAVARVVGDPCYDRLVAGRARRAGFRRMLGLEPDSRLVVVTSTRTTSSLLGSASHQLERLVEQLPSPEFRIALLIHPNAVAAHGAYQVRAWLSLLAARGLILTRPEDDWEPYLTAADYIIGDHGCAQLDPVAMARVSRLISSEPGGFARHTRDLLYGMLGLGQPATPARLEKVAA